MFYQRLHFAARRVRRKRHGRLLACLARDALGALGLEPFPRRHKARKRLRQLGYERLACRCWQVVARQQRLADRSEMSEALNDAIKRERRNLGARILDQDQTRLRRTDFRDRGGHRRRKAATVGDGKLDPRVACGRRIDEIAVDHQRRMLQHPARNLRLGTSLGHSGRAQLSGSDRAPAR